MSYFPTLGGEMPTGIKGTALITADNLYNSWTYGSSLSYRNNLTFGLRASNWTTSDITGDFDAINNNGVSLLPANNNPYSGIRVNTQKKLLLIGYYATNSLSSTSYARGYLSVQLGAYSNRAYRNQYDKISTCTNYFNPNYNLGGQNVYSDSLNENLNSSEIGKYFKIAGINKLDDNLMYTYMETSTYPSTYLTFSRNYCTSGASSGYISTSPPQHSIYMIQFY